MNNDDINVLQRKQERWDGEMGGGGDEYSFVEAGKRCVKWISRRVTERVEGERTRYKAPNGGNSKLSKRKNALSLSFSFSLSLLSVVKEEDSSFKGSIAIIASLL